MGPLLSLFHKLLPPAALVAALFVGGCGIKGPLELPEGSSVPASEAKGRFVPNANTRLPGYYEASSKEKKAQKQLGNPAKPDEPFILDPLLN